MSTFHLSLVKTEVKSSQFQFFHNLLQILSLDVMVMDLIGAVAPVLSPVEQPKGIATIMKTVLVISSVAQTTASLHSQKLQTVATTLFQVSKYSYLDNDLPNKVCLEEILMKYNIQRYSNVRGNLFYLNFCTTYFIFGCIVGFSNFLNIP